ncbi:kinase-like protein [Piedraia hortae CBS 480.64]|uniref:non-specific serine/threonine protein kinase n=1 Tax=Piedraia hortae CBS 480.64 TaxID=1314780 RepID=A0A6A7CAN3_9PEZI|nr:kinase-like protein [Piedraia hortae CBS 480.64]
MHHRSRLVDLLIWSLVPQLANALQKRLGEDVAAGGVSGGLSVGLHQPPDSLQTTPSGDSPSLAHKLPNERALATFDAPASAVRAFSSASAVPPTAGLATRLAARTLQDWQVEELILLATVDGSIHARNRSTGAPHWVLALGQPMVETTYRRNRSGDGVPEDPVWVIEPTQDGGIFYYDPIAGSGLQRLGLTVKELADRSPYAYEGPPAVVYTMQKLNSLYMIDAANGSVIGEFGTAASANNTTCPPAEALDVNRCESGRITIGKTEYIINIQDINTREVITRLRYFEWTPNNRDQDLLAEYKSSIDGQYFYSTADGTINCMQTVGEKVASNTAFNYTLDSPIVRAFDLVKPTGDDAKDSPLTLLPQPRDPLLKSVLHNNHGSSERVRVNCTSDDSCFALSEVNYPAIAEGIPVADYYVERVFGYPRESSWRGWPRKLSGVHFLDAQGPQPIRRISGPVYPGIEGPPIETEKPMSELSPKQSPSYITRFILLLTVFTTLLAFYVAHTKKTPAQTRKHAKETVESDSKPRLAPAVREAEPAKETIFAGATANETPLEKVEFPASEEKENQVPAADEVEPDLEPKVNHEPTPAGEGAVKPKAKHPRGRRGGRKEKERQRLAAERWQQQQQQQQPSTVSIQESEEKYAGPLKINNLIIFKDSIIGEGNGGTLVFEGMFENRKVAVKRMLSHHYQLASQEVNFLQQSDDHPNVVRYFCQEKDDHFLYIAVELCQASLYDIWEFQRAKTAERRQQLENLKDQIQQDIPSALLQLAKGLCHLHELRIIHRDIKPHNILVAFPKPGQTKTRIVISDFGLGRNLPENASTIVDPTGNVGTVGWKAPELITQHKEGDGRSSTSSATASDKGLGAASGVKRAADIFSMGCLFYWVMTDGVHPFANESDYQFLRDLHIINDQKNMEKLASWEDTHEAMTLITWMLEHQPERRPTAQQVLNHPFFWPPKKRLAFLCDVSDHFEKEPRGRHEDGYKDDSPNLCVLEACATEVIGPKGNFLAILDKAFVDTLGKQRKYTGNRMLDLLRALRNKKNHYEDMTDEMKRRVGPLPDGYLNYWCRKFPHLLMACYQVIRTIELEQSNRFKEYFMAL